MPRSALITDTRFGIIGVKSGKCPRVRSYLLTLTGRCHTDCRLISGVNTLVRLREPLIMSHPLAYRAETETSPVWS
jgi:acyl-CoA synthetase (AMP-forming)/AMP-acid ligase II